MLDRKIKDYDASMELLKDRKKTLMIYFYIFLVIGWSLTLGSAMFLGSIWDDVGMGIGIAVLIYATWWYIGILYYVILIKIEKKLGDKTDG